MIEYYKENYPELYERILEWNDTAKKLSSLYHATTYSSALEILSSELKTEHCGKIHGEMCLKPNEKTIYFSRHEKSNNLNSNLFEQSNDIVLLEVDTKYMDWDSVYPDDAMFVGFASEDYLCDEDDAAETFDISIQEATLFFEELCQKKDDEIADFLKPLWGLYLMKEGEISIAQNISGLSIKAIRDYNTGELIEDKKALSLLNDHKIAKAFSKKHGIKIESILGSGNSGVAYKMIFNQVLKITQDDSEFLNAHQLKNIHNEHIVDIYDATQLKDGKYAILQEYVETREARANYEELMEWAEDVYGWDIDSLLMGELPIDLEMPHHLVELFNDIKNFQEEVCKNKISSTDLTEGNIGRRANGKYVVFDISEEDLSSCLLYTSPSPRD